jgi:hypothetical protein
VPEWKQRLGFSDLRLEIKENEWDLVGSMSAARRAAKATRPGDRRNPFGIAWPKPAASGYPTLYFGGVINRVKSQSVLRGIFTRGQNDETGTRVQEYGPTSRKRLSGGEMIGLMGDNRVAINKIVGPLTTASTPGGGRILSILEKYGFSAASEGRDGDHVTEIQFGGQDAVDNLWPLDFSINRGAGSKLAKAKVTYPSGKVVSITELKDFGSRRYYFKITSTL